MIITCKLFDSANKRFICCVVVTDLAAQLFLTLSVCEVSAATSMEDTTKTASRRSKRKAPKRDMYVPAETIRSRATNPKKRASSRYQKIDKPNKQKAISFKQTSRTISHQNIKAHYPLYNKVENTSFEIMKLMKTAIQLEEDFSNTVKIEFPNFRCNLCFKNFSLKRYRKVLVYYV